MSVPLPLDVCAAAYRGDLTPILKWLQQGGHVDALDESRGAGMLHAAASAGRLRVVNALLLRGASVDLRGLEDRTALMTAALGGQRAIVEYLLEHKASIDLQDDEGATALINAAYFGHKACVQELLQAGASTELPNRYGVTVLEVAKAQVLEDPRANDRAVIAKLLRQHERAASIAASTPPMPAEILRAASYGELQPVIEWLQQGGHVDALDERGAGLLHAAATAGQLRVARELLQRGASVDLPVGHECTPLLGAATQGERAMVCLLLEHKASIDLQTSRGWNALMQAAQEGQRECVLELLQAGASAELRNENGDTAMRTAKTAGHATIAQLIWQHGAKPPASVAMTLPAEVGLAARHGETQLIVRWLEQGGHVDAVNESGVGLLHAAASAGQLRVAKELLQRGASVDLRGSSKFTALLGAAKMGQAAMVRLLLQHKASIDLQTASGSTALMQAASEGHAECVQELLQAGANTELRDRAGHTAVQAAAGRGHAAIFQLIKQHIAKQPASDAMTLPAEVGLAAGRGEVEAVVRWLEQGGHVDALEENGCGLLHVAASNGSLRVARELLQRGASVDLLIDRGATALMAAALMGQNAIVRLLIEHKASIDLQNDEGGTALMVAAGFTPDKGHMECVQVLLEAGASTELRDLHGLTALQTAEIGHRTATVKLLRRHAANPRATVAALTPNLSGSRVRIGGLQARPELNGRLGLVGRFNEAKGRYAVAVEGEAGAVLECSWLKSANLHWYPQQTNEGNTSAAPPSAESNANVYGRAAARLRQEEVTPAEQPHAVVRESLAQHLTQEVVSAANTGDMKQVVGWLNRGGHVDAPDDRVGLLHDAASTGRLRVVEELLKLGVSVDVRDRPARQAHYGVQNVEGETALMGAAKHGQTDCVQLLLQWGASTELRDLGDCTALHTAKKEGHTAIVRLLQQHKAKPSAASSKAPLTAEARAAAEAAADRVAEELLAEEEAEEASKAGAGKKKKKKKKKKGGGAASSPAVFSSTAEPAAAEPAAATPTPSARELATAALQQAIDAGELEPLRKAIGTHGAAANGTDVLREAVLKEAVLHRKAAKGDKQATARAEAARAAAEAARAAVEAAAAEVAEAVAESEAAVAAAAERANAEARVAAKEKAAAEQADAERAAAAQKKSVAAERVAAAFTAEQAATAARLAAERVEEESRLEEALARSMASLQADEERRCAPTRVVSDSGQGAEATASGRPLLTLADVGDITGRNDVPESSIGGETTCIVCMVHPKTHLAVPCAHQCACGTCAEQMQLCPYCRVPVQRWLQVRIV